MTTAPDTYLGNPIPDHLKTQWRAWEAAEWRQQQHTNTGRLYPPDERFNVQMPRDLCERHADNWLGYRNMRFDSVTGDEWPGIPGSPFLFVGHDIQDLREQRRAQWDGKASMAMRKVERMCRSGRGDSCFPLRKTASAAPNAAEAAADLPLTVEAA